MYQSIMNGPFRFDHCWDILKNEEKWKSRDNSSSTKRKLPGSSRRVTAEHVNLVEDDEPTKVDTNERPIGRKLAKERKRTSKAADMSGLASVLAALKEEKQKVHSEKIERTSASNQHKSEFLQIQKSQLMEAQLANQIHNEKLRLQTVKLRLEQDKEDDSIMMKDLSGLDYEQRKYFERRRLEIQQRKCGNV